MWELLFAGALSGLVIGSIATYEVIHHVTVRRLIHQRDCYRTALNVLELNGYFDHKAEELVRQYTSQVD